MTSNSRRVLGIVGSPRRNGNTDTLVDEVLAGAKESGASTQKVRLIERVISPCGACDVCRKKGKCVQQDDMSDLLDEMWRSDVWVLGTPVYWWGPTAQFKAFLDRWYGVINQSHFKNKRIVLVVPLEDNSASVYGPILDMFRGIIDYLDMNHVATVLATGLLEKAAATKHDEILVSARKAGREAGR
ncbi:MAG: flavodoxin family protein [Candidatus Thorarchaeota archaeon]|nr:MAG: flavodoxin family protein [Candidatus Thorarchaeota archaeon]